MHLWMFYNCKFRVKGNESETRRLLFERILKNNLFRFYPKIPFSHDKILLHNKNIKHYIFDGFIDRCLDVLTQY